MQRTAYHSRKIGISVSVNREIDFRQKKGKQTDRNKAGGKNISWMEKWKKKKDDGYLFIDRNHI